VFTVSHRFSSTVITNSCNKELAQRGNKRKGSDIADPRTELQFQNNRVSINISHLSWMDFTRQILPQDFEIHHLDENPLNNHPSNLIAVHKLDHLKLHQNPEPDSDPDPDPDPDPLPF
jgi:hypothetical protein